MNTSKVYFAFPPETSDEQAIRICSDLGPITHYDINGDDEEFLITITYRTAADADRAVFVGVFLGGVNYKAGEVYENGADVIAEEAAEMAGFNAA